MKRSLLVLDLGTTRVKLARFEEGSGIGLVDAMDAPLAIGPDGQAEQDIDTTIAAVVALLRRQGHEAARTEALVVTGQMGGVGLIDSQARPMTQWITAMDHRCRASASALHAEAGRAIRSRGGATPFQAERLRWLVENRRIADDAMPMLLPSLVATQLASERGEAAYCDRTSLAWSGLADTASGKWDDELVAASGWSRRRLPPIIEPGARIGHLAPDVAQATGLPSALPILAGPGDQAASFYGLGICQVGDVVDVASSFPMFAGVAKDFRPFADPHIDIMPSVYPGLWHPLGYLAGTSASLRWLANDFFGAEMEELEDEAASSDARGGLIAIPPGADHELAGTGSVLGLNLSHRRGDVYRAFMEGLAIEFAEIAKRLRTGGVELCGPAVSTGGGATSDLLRATKAAAVGIPFVRSLATESTLVGTGRFLAEQRGWDSGPEPGTAEPIVASPEMREHMRTTTAQYHRFRSAVRLLHGSDANPEAVSSCWHLR